MKQKTKTCIIYDWNGKQKKVKVPYSTRKVTIEIITGDMVMIKPIYADSSNNRDKDFFDGSFSVALKDCEMNEKGEYLICEPI